MSETSRRLFAAGLRMAGAGLRRKTDWQVRQEQIKDQIARLLTEQAGLEADIRIDYDAMPEGARTRMLTIAARAIADLDPLSDAEIIEQAVAETLGWAAGLTHQPHPEDLLRESLSRYKALRVSTGEVI
jgi:hypothetical protein